MSENSASVPDSRSGRLSRRCLWCRNPLPEKSRTDRKYCSVDCRRLSHIAHQHEGRVASVRRLKSGLMSVVVHMPDVGLQPGRMVRVMEGEDHADT